MGPGIGGPIHCPHVWTNKLKVNSLSFDHWTSGPLFLSIHLPYIVDALHRETFALLQALHHPFTAPNPEDMEDLSSARALAYDMVYNGVEVCAHGTLFANTFNCLKVVISSTWNQLALLGRCYQIGGGSLRIYKREIQEKVLEIVGISPEQVRGLFRSW